MRMPSRPHIPERLRFSSRTNALLILVTSAVAGVLFALLAIPSAAGVSLLGGVIGGVLAGLILAGSFLGYRFLAPRLGMWTSVAALMVVWALFWGATALIPGQCSGTGTLIHGCTLADIGSFAVVGFAFPLSFAAIIIPGIITFRFFRYVVRRILLRTVPSYRLPEDRRLLAESAGAARLSAEERRRARSGNPAVRAGSTVVTTD